jgi:hypothetical protein
MQSILNYIEQKNQVFADSPIFQFIRSEDADPNQKFVYIPCISHFVFSFMDMNLFVLRDENSDDPYQKLVNIHTEEDAHHWPWYLKDLETLGLDKTMKFSEALRFIWSDATKASRLLTYKFCQLAYNASPLERLVIVEAVEQTGKTFLSLSAIKSKELEASQELYYFGENHSDCETGHHMGTDGVVDYLGSIVLTDAERERCQKTVDTFFEIYTAFTNDAIKFTQNYQYQEVKESPIFIERITHDWENKFINHAA